MQLLVMLSKGILLALLATVKGSVNEFDAAYGVYRDNTDQELMQDFYKRLASIDLQDVKRAIGADVDYEQNAFLPEDYRGDSLYPEQDEEGGHAMVADDRQAKIDDDEMEGFIGDKSTMIRDPELTQHSSNLGILRMTEDQQSKSGSNRFGGPKNLKSDDPLPFYCHPPNPCPKGYTSKENNCQEFVEDTADFQKEWIHEMQRKGICSCDEEHMFDCSSSSSSFSSSASSSSSTSSSASSSSPEEGRNLGIGSKQEMDEFFNSFVKEKGQENPFTQRGQKRISLVAKKSPRSKRDTGAWQMDLEMDKIARQSSNNPYLSGNKLPTVAKKGFKRA